MKIAVFVVLAGLAVNAAPAIAQEHDLVLGPEFEQRFDELEKWLKEYHAWEEWFEQWGNRLARNFNDDLIGSVRSVPNRPPGSRRSVRGIWASMGC
jgi:hypothetical protein